MKSLIIALIMIVPFVGMGQKVESVIGNRGLLMFPNNINRGHVKFIKTKADTIPCSNKKGLLDKLNFFDYLVYKHRNDSVVYNSRGLSIESYSYFDSSHKLTHKGEWKYDSSDNMIEIIETEKENILLNRITYKYDSLNNCIEKTTYNGHTKITSIEGEERKQDGNITTEYVYTTNSAGEKKLMYILETELEKNKKTVSNYNPDGHITYKTEEERIGNTTYSTYSRIATNGKIIFENKSTITRKKNKKIVEGTSGANKYHSRTILNDYGDPIEMHDTRYDNEKIFVNYVVTYSYEYDSKGNYTKKIIYLDKQPIIEINRVIGYFD